MDRTFFALKRAYHSTLRISRRDFKEIELTPARMDILHVLYNRGRTITPPIWQSTLRRIIGYTARSTMSQIMKALEKLGLVRRKRCPQNERQLEVELTDDGWARLGRAYVRFATGWVHVAPTVASGWRAPNKEEDEAWRAFVERMGRLNKLLYNIRFALRDTGCVRYPLYSD
ncbi:MAG TPA: MarR family transcriptional regulator [Polyangiaceae bacterium]|jgi:DNA-binding MarR family transcriptional regulator|nr:MarR family transcriptional regulator [Polyangiaceae bacterium]